MLRAGADLADAAARALRELPPCAGEATPAGPLRLRGVEWLAGEPARLDADLEVRVRAGLSIGVEDGLPAERIAADLARSWRRLPAALRAARTVLVLGRPAPGRERVNANAHVDSGTLWFWSPQGQPQCDLTTLAHELAHLLVPEPGRGLDDERDAFLRAWAEVVAADRAVLQGLALQSARYAKPRPGAPPLLVDLCLAGGELRPYYAPAWRVEEDYAESVALFVRDALEGGLGLVDGVDRAGDAVEIGADDPRQRLAALLPARAAACAAMLDERAALAA